MKQKKLKITTRRVFVYKAQNPNALMETTPTTTTTAVIV